MNVTMPAHPGFEGNIRLRRTTLVASLLLALLVTFISLPLALAAEESTDVSPKIEELLNLLADPAVQQWLEAQRAEPIAPNGVDLAADDPAALVARRLDFVREHLAGLAIAAGRLPAELNQGWRNLRDIAGDRSPMALLLMGGLCIGLGFAARWLYGRVARRHPDGLDEAIAATPRLRLTVLWRRLLHGLGSLVAFAAGAIGSYLLVDWPAPFQFLVLGLILACLCVLAVRLVLLAMLSPAGESGAAAGPLRIVPMDDLAAGFWTHRITTAAIIFAFGWALANLLQTIGVSLNAVHLLVYLIGIVLLGLGLNMVWRGPRASAAGPEAASTAVPAVRWRSSSRWAWSLYFLIIWVVWVAGAMNLFWLVVVAGLLPASILLCKRAIAHVFQAEVADGQPVVPSVAAAVLERGLRALFIVAAVLLLAWGWNIDVAHVAEQDTLITRVVAGVFTAIVILLVSDLLWQILKAFIGLQIARAQIDDAPAAEDIQRRTRLLTLLPIVRNVLFVTIAVIAVLMALAAIGLEIGPLVAGAGVVGVAIGFGAQTLVKDIISGMFYLLDDAFRVGEYIESGSFKGTVESFSLRSIRLRHHNGPMFTVPFGELGAIQNMSRDWVITKFDIGITYDSDIGKARKIIKKIGLELADDPEFKADVIEPLKMQGVQAFGDYAVQLRVKMMTKPGGQFGLRRQALAMIKQAFDENGIKIAFPTVTIAGKPADGDTAAAQNMIARLSKQPDASNRG